MHGQGRDFRCLLANPLRRRHHLLEAQIVIDSECTETFMVMEPLKFQIRRPAEPLSKMRATVC